MLLFYSTLELITTRRSSSLLIYPPPKILIASYVSLRIEAWISSSVFPFVSGTIFATKIIVITAKAEYMQNVPTQTNSQTKKHSYVSVQLPLECGFLRFKHTDLAIEPLRVCTWRAPAHEKVESVRHSPSTRPVHQYH